MKFLHLGDLHIGKNLHEFDLIDDQRYILSEILALAENKKVDAVLVAGDVYDKSIPSEAAVRLLDWFICQLACRKIKTFMISGNHDSDERLGFGSEIFRAGDVYISAKYDGELVKETVNDEFGPVNIWLMPFVKGSQVRYFHPEEQIGNYDDAVRTVIRKSEIDTGERNVLVAHQFVAGDAVEPVLGGSESAATKSVGTVEKVGSDCFDAFDYVALGHIHAPQAVGREHIRYAGSPLKYSLSEAGKSKLVTLVNLGAKGDVSVELLPLHPRRDVRHLRGPMAQLLNKDNIAAPEDYIYVTLTDEDPISNAMEIFQQVYPNTVHIDYDNSHTRQVESADISQIGENKSFVEIVSDFYRTIYGCDISEEELKLMKEVAGEAGVNV